MKNFNYFYNALSLPSGNFQIYYDFSQSGSNPIPSISGANPLYSGNISNVSNFYQNSDSGYFSGQNISIYNASGLSSDYFTTFFVYEKTNSGNAILYSSLQSGLAISGFVIGINDANRLYFETFDQNGPNIYTSSNVYGNKNAISVVKAGNLLKFHYFNFNYQEIESEQFIISSTAFYQSNQAYLGAAINPPSYINQNKFTGYFDQFIYINSALASNTVEHLFSGFYSNKNPDTMGIVAECYHPITGGQVIYTGVGTGITGFNTFLAGTIYDNCGNVLPVYSSNNATGIIYQNVFFPLTGTICYNVTGIIDNGYFLDTGYCNSFGMNGVSYLRTVVNNDFQELYTYPKINITGTNLNAEYNLDGTFKLDSFYINNQIELYVNGISNFPSGYYISGNGYINNLYLSGDFYISGQSIISTGFYQSNDILTYDNTSGIKEIYNLTGTDAQNFSTSNVNNRIVFLNGQKMISGNDYTFTNNSLHILPSAATGKITNLPFLSGYSYNTGHFTNIQLPKFSRHTSEIWMNGQKQVLNNDYVEISNIDLLNGSGLFFNFNNLLYDNSRKFLEIF